MINYDPHSWRQHFFDIKGSMVRQIIYRVLACVVFAAAVTYVHIKQFKVHFGPTTHGLIGVALGLLLVFRTNASYDRFWEGRKLWGGIVNETRNLARISLTLLHDQAPALHAELVRWTVVWCYASMTHLRGKVELGHATEQLPPEVVKKVAAAQHIPLAIALRMTALLEEARQRGLLSDWKFYYADQNVQLLIDYLGGCERIHKTPLPFAYVVHLRRALLLYCFSLPFALVESLGWGTIAGVFAIAYILFGIEEIGVEIEDPFGLDDNDLPLEGICETIQRNLEALIPVEGSNPLKVA